MSDKQKARAFIREHMYHWFEPDEAGKHDAEKVAYDALLSALRSVREEERERNAANGRTATPAST